MAHDKTHIIQTPTGPLALATPVAVQLLKNGVISGDLHGVLHATDAAIVKSAIMAIAICDFCSAPGATVAFDVPDFDMPVIGRDAFRTATGVHAAAVVKAWKKGDRELMDAVYSAIPASLVGREQVIEVGPMSGKSNVTFWLEKRGIAASEQVVDRVFRRAKSSRTVLTEAEILAEVYR